MMMLHYHHYETLNSLCRELAEAGYKEQARQLHTLCLTSDEDSERAKVLRTLVRGVREIRAAEVARELFVVETAARLIQIVKRDSAVLNCFLLSPMKAAEKALDKLLEVSNLENARKKLQAKTIGQLHHIDDFASKLILDQLDLRLRDASVWLSIYSARAGGWILQQYKENTVEPMLEALKDSEALDYINPDLVKDIL